MDVSYILDPLNEHQREAVCAPEGPMLVLAGAGSGKTRVLTHRVAWLVQALHVSPLSILAVTFTNKAAQEMRGRIEQMLGYPMRGMWIGTFHSIAHRLLRAHWREAGLEQGFQILDSDDQIRLIKRALKELNLDEGYWPPRQVQWYINGHKEEGRRPHHIEEPADAQQRELLRIYRTYEELCQRFSLVDFSELLLRAYELIKNNEPLCQRYQQRFLYVLVDEFQDTNAVQYEWLKLFAARHRNIFVVGDDDQSIYGWRGARVENILQFERDFHGANVARLEQNYRSTANILNIANAIIDNNQGRLGKQLWTSGEEGESVKLYVGYNEIDEARFVVDRIQSWADQGNAYSDAAILYRSNAQSRVFEEVLVRSDIPYRVYGGLRFFERAEIKDALAYLRMIAGRQDDPSFERIVNTPTRGIGNRTVEQIREYARINQTSMWNGARALIQQRELPSRTLSALVAFVDLINQMAEAVQGAALADAIETMLQRSGLITHFAKDKGEKGQARKENLEELITAARNYEHNDEEGMDPLSAFLSHAALEAGERQGEEWEECVQLMSLHSAKGLEFPLVFLTGMEEGLFPHQRSLQESGRLEEERRLCYVGMTRAMQILYISYAWSRTKPAEKQSDSIQLGGRVRHNSFGDGVVLGVEGRGEHTRVQVNFESVGNKWLVLAYANLEKL